MIKWWQGIKYNHQERRGKDENNGLFERRLYIGRP